MQYNLNVVIEHDPDGYYAYVPQLPGCQSQGDSFEEAMSNIKEAVELYVGSLSQEEKDTLLTKEIYTSSIPVPLA